MNIPAVLAIFKALRDPSLCLPHSTVTHLSQLPIPVSTAFVHYAHRASGTSVSDNIQTSPHIRAIVLDKDNCFALPRSNTIDPSCNDIISSLKQRYPSSALLIVSNTAGYTRRDPDLSAARALEAVTGISVLSHKYPKPHSECGEEIVRWFRERGVVENANEVAVVGDRLFTDVMLAKTMGAWAIWVREGVKKDSGLWTKGEWWMEQVLKSRGWEAKRP